MKVKRFEKYDKITIINRNDVDLTINNKDLRSICNFDVNIDNLHTINKLTDFPNLTEEQVIELEKNGSLTLVIKKEIIFDITK